MYWGAAQFCCPALPVAHGTAEGTHRFLAHDELLHLLHLGHVVLVGLQLALADALIDPDQHLPWDVLPIIHPCRAKLLLAGI